MNSWGLALASPALKSSRRSPNLSAPYRLKPTTAPGNLPRLPTGLALLVIFCYRLRGRSWDDLFQGAPPVTGPEAIRQFWEARIKLGGRDVKFEIIDVGADGRYAYQVTKTTAQLVRDTGEKIPVSGHTVRIFERQRDGSWKTKVHMFNRPNAP